MPPHHTACKAWSAHPPDGPYRTCGQANLKWFVLLALLSFWYMLQTCTAILTFFLSPDKFAFNLCVGARTAPTPRHLSAATVSSSREQQS